MLTQQLLQPIINALGPEAKLHLVGGSVRDSLLGQDKFDCDLACALPAPRTKSLLEGASIRVIETGLQHGTITAVVNDQNIEITSYRHPGSAHPADKIEQDLGYRDFTINAIAYSLVEQRFIDPLNGMDDLAAGIVRTTGPAEERFKDDPLRILRAIRFGQAAGRKVDAQILVASKSCAALLTKVSVERIREEFKKIIISEYAADGVRALAQLDLLQFIVPELIHSIGFEQNDFHVHDVFEHTLWVLQRCPNDLILRLSAIFHDIAKPMTLSIDEQGRRHFYRHEEIGAEIAQKVMERLKFSNHEIDAVRCIVRHHMRPIDCGPPGLRRIMRDLGERYDAWRIFKSADAPPKTTQSEIESAFARFDAMYQTELERLKGAPYGKLAIDGEDLKALGVRPGPKLGAILRGLEEIVLDDPSLNQKETLLAKAREIIERRQ
ncbi:MAG: CCA tRNA nucleotidyltransferase [Oligoflexia bacterium]|nr:CCA tRNA nucleotidyltransferase [Oligoflexia bacterium]